jgi:hypothetical protein
MAPEMSRREVSVTKISLHACFALMVVLFLTGCFNTMEQRWEAIDTDLRAEIGVKKKDYYIAEWGNPAKRVRSEDGGEALDILRIRRCPGLAKDLDVHTGRSLERF